MAAYYEIRVAGMLPSEVLRDFELLSAAPAPVETVLHGPLPDQAALAAFLARLENFGANVIEIRWLRERRSPLDDPRQDRAGQVRAIRADCSPSPGDLPLAAGGSR
jgi:hypothetical protein